jgi:hypothetical protein
VVRPASRGPGHDAASYRPRCFSVAQGLGARAVAQGQCPAAFTGRRKTLASQALTPKP